MADTKPEGDAPAAAAPGGAKGGLGAWLPLILTLVAMPALAYGMTTFVIVPQIQKAVAPLAGVEGGEGGAPARAGGVPARGGSGTKESVPLTKMVVNVAGTMGTRYLLSSMTLVGTTAGFKAKVEQNRDLLLDLASSALSNKTIADLERPGARNEIRMELLTVFNQALGADMVQELYITEFAIQ
ncbi:MAG: flagellar basal body-associated FliL family protein [Verrucomicrobiae bacterium]|nr:flagellar basal body-associated FliL family protein [Verrucomicrobiae bacterium]